MGLLSMSSRVAHLPQQVPIEAYGNGGFRFGGMSHRGSILSLPTGIWEWPVCSLAALSRASLADALDPRHDLALFILGTGPALRRPAPEISAAFREAGVGLEPMDTGAASRTYNILLAEGRRVGAGLIAVA